MAIKKSTKTTSKTRKPRRRRAKKSFFSWKKVSIIVILLSSLLFGFVWYLFQSGHVVFVDKAQKSQKHEKIDESKLISKMKDMLKEQKQQIEKELKKIKQAKKKADKELSIEDLLKKQKPSESEDFSQNSNHVQKKPKAPKKPKNDKKDTKPKKDTKKPAHKNFTPKLAIIIDDVSFEAQAKKIKEIPYRVTPSFMPPTKSHPSTPKMAKRFDVYMVHLPMEAFSYAHPEPRTLLVGESFESIDRWITKLHAFFPRAAYFNNHTGSKFTSNAKSMDYLIRSLKSKNIKFLDSKTTPKSKVSQVASRYEYKVLSRDVFLDNIFSEQYIKDQLKQAVELAKKRGHAIAICHPHAITLKVLKGAKPLLKGVKLVYIDAI